MGLGSRGGDVLYFLENLTHVDVINYGWRMLHRTSSGTGTVGRPVFDVDCNNVINVLGSAADPVAATAGFLKDWAQYGVCVTPICDGDTRPQSKQQSNKSRSNRQRNKHNAVILRQELRGVSTQLLEDGGDGTVRETLEKTRDDLRGRIKRAET